MLYDEKVIAKANGALCMNLGKQQMNEWGSQGVPFLFIIDYEMKDPVIIPLHGVNNQEILFTINGKGNYQSPRPDATAHDFYFEKTPIDFLLYQQAFEQIIHHIHRGDSFLVNLTFPTEIKTNLTLKEIFFRSEAPYKLWYKHQFICFSPEAFVRINDGRIASYPMKGTIDVAIPDARDTLLSNTKELAEHVTIVDLIRNDLSMYAEQVQVKRFRYVETIKTTHKTLLQVSSEITGKLPPHYTQIIGDIIFSMLPAGSICGAPKQKTLEIIRNCEMYSRGYYTGVFGYFDGKNLESAVMIRFIELDNGKLVYKSGGGITAHSQVVSEYQELIDKVYVPVN